MLPAEGMSCRGSFSAASGERSAATTTAWMRWSSGSGRPAGVVQEAVGEGAADGHADPDGGRVPFEAP
ncbi:MAG: hypothetical protein IRZ13_01350 [Acetobacteraceae bacterium]|nr:hypothetical protein [Acetobacteraceae bacterium]